MPGISIAPTRGIRLNVTVRPRHSVPRRNCEHGASRMEDEHQLAEIKERLDAPAFESNWREG